MYNNMIRKLDPLIPAPINMAVLFQYYLAFSFSAQVNDSHCLILNSLPKSFEQGTLFGIHIRFVHRDDAIAAQKWKLDLIFTMDHVYTLWLMLWVRDAVLSLTLFMLAQMYHYMLPLMRNI